MLYYTIFIKKEMFLKGHPLMNRMALSNSLDSATFELLDRLTEDLGPPKNRILEAAIQVFGALPIEIQLILKSNRQEDRALCLDLIRKLGVPPKPKAPARKANSSKVQ
jgi:hypothetical protein